MGLYTRLHGCFKRCKVRLVGGGRTRAASRHHAAAEKVANDERLRLRLALIVMFSHMAPMSASHSVLPHLLLPLVGGSSGELARLIGLLSITTSVASLVAVPILAAMSDGYWGRKRILLFSLSLDVVGELLLSSGSVRSSRLALVSLAPIRAVSSSVMPLCAAAVAIVHSGAGSSSGARGNGQTNSRHNVIGERFGAIGGAVHGALIVGPLVGSAALQTLGPAAPFLLGAGMTFCALLLVLCFWPDESPPPRASNTSEGAAAPPLSMFGCSPVQGLWLFFHDRRQEPGGLSGGPAAQGEAGRGSSITHDAATPATVAGRGATATNNKARLRVLGLCFLVEHAGMATTAILFPFVRLRFGWDHRPFSVYLSFTSSLRMLGSAVGVPLLLRSGFAAPTTVMTCALAGRAVELLCIALAVWQGWQLWALSVLTLFTALAEPLLRAAMVTCVEPSQVGALQGILSAGQLLTMRGIGPYVMAELFATSQASSVWGGGLPFLLASGLFSASAGILLVAMPPTAVATALRQPSEKDTPLLK